MTNAQSRPVLLVLDLDETLVHASEKELGYPPAFEVFGYPVYPRPFLEKFLLEMSKHFSLGIWSSAGDPYVECVAEKIKPEGVNFEFVWGNSRCTFRRNIKLDGYGYYENVYEHQHYVKPLKKLKKKGYDLQRMLIVDDSPHKCSDNYGNAIYPRPFEGDPYDNELLLLMEYLLSLKDKPNLRKIEKRKWRDSFQFR